jgi:hypothetical protein
MAGYAEDDRSAVISALIDAWAYFDAHAYADEVLHRLPLRNRVVRLTHSGQWAVVRRLTSVDTLQIRYPFSDFAALRELAPLDLLAIFNSQGVVNLHELAAQSSLSFFAVLGHASLQRLDALAELPELRVLYLGLAGTPSLDGLRLGSDVRDLSILDLRADTDLGPLADQQHVTSLELLPLGSRLHNNLGPVFLMPRLAQLSLHDADLTAWASEPPAFPTNLKQLSLYNCLLPEGRPLTLPGVEIIAH